MRQKFVDNTVHQVHALGMSIPDADLKWDEETGHYQFGEIDWTEFYQVINGHGMCNHERIKAKQQAWQDGEWVREAALAHSKKTDGKCGLTPSSC